MAIKVNDFIKELKEMKVADLNELVKAIEEEFNVTAAAPVAAAAGAAAPESSEKTVQLINGGGNKISVIKAIREIMGLALMDAKKFVDNGGAVKENIPSDEADELAAKLKELGAEVEIK